MSRWFDRALDRELGPGGDRVRPARDPWRKDWPLLLGLVLSAALIAASTAVRASSADPADQPRAAESAGAGVSGDVVDVGDDSSPAPRDGGGGASPAGAKATKKPRRARPDSGAATTGDAAPVEPSADGKASSSGGGASARARKPVSAPSGGGSAPQSRGEAPTTPGKLVNVTGTSASYSNGPLSYTFRAPTHTPVVGRRWVLSIDARRSGKPLAGKVKVDILHNGSVVGHAASGPLRNGRFAQKLDWPAESVGHPLTVKATVVGGGYQQSFLFNVKVRAAG